MAKEIERKFLLKNDLWQGLVTPKHSIQGYLASGPPASVRLRIMDGEARLNIKQSVVGMSRDEYEYPIPTEDAQEMLNKLCVGPIVEKKRHHIEFEGFLWEVDEFLGDNQGLVVAEIVLESTDQAFPRPPWIEKEVTNEIRYYNSQLSKHPYCTWDPDE